MDHGPRPTLNLEPLNPGQVSKGYLVGVVTVHVGSLVGSSWAQGVRLFGVPSLSLHLRQSSESCRVSMYLSSV